MRIQVVYIGVVEIVGNKVGHKYLLIENGQLGRDFVFAKQLVPCGIGAITECTEVEEAVKGPYERKGFYENEAKCAVWTADSRATQAVVKEQKAIANKDLENPLFRRLDPLRDLYRRTPAAKRRYILADILRYITG